MVGRFPAGVKVFEEIKKNLNLKLAHFDRHSNRNPRIYY